MFERGGGGVAGIGECGAGADLFGAAGAVIGVAGGYAAGSVELFGQERADEEVGPGQRA